MACEKCWADAWLRSYVTGWVKTQAECYAELLEERKDNPCSKEEEIGVYLPVWHI
jgi:hypothetical protein